MKGSIMYIVSKAKGSETHFSSDLNKTICEETVEKDWLILSRIVKGFEDKIDCKKCLVTLIQRITDMREKYNRYA
jgi:hypothetical protein